MTLLDFIGKTNLDDSLILGYYGGGNYGDELLLEVLQNLLAQKPAHKVHIAYQRPELFRKMHHDLGCKPFHIQDKPALLRATLRCRTLIVGGGGLWGVDMNLNTLLMSVYLWICRWLLRKNVYLLGVGYYTSTPAIGRLGAWFAAKAANRIFARDHESYANFYAIAGPRVTLDKDLAWYIRSVPLEPYTDEARALGKKLGIKAKTLLLTIRRPQAKRQHTDFASFNALIGNFIAANQDKPIIAAQLELTSVDPEGHAQLQQWQRTYQNLSILDSPINPLVLYTFFQLYHDKLVLIGPQFHIMLTAHLNDVPFLPLSYDNKVDALLETVGVIKSARLPIAHARQAHLQQFSDIQLAA